MWSPKRKNSEGSAPTPIPKDVFTTDVTIGVHGPTVLIVAHTEGVTMRMIMTPPMARHHAAQIIQQAAYIEEQLALEAAETDQN